MSMGSFRHQTGGISNEIDALNDLDLDSDEDLKVGVDSLYNKMKYD